MLIIKKTHKLLFIVISIFNLTQFLSSAESVERLPYKNLVEQNKTWWYKGAVMEQEDSYYDYYYFGIKIEGDTVIDNNKYAKCWVLDIEKNKILPCPVALLREENKRIIRYPVDEAFEKYRYDFWSNTDNKYFKDLIGTLVLTAKDGYSISMFRKNYSYEDYLSSPEDYPLYDFLTEKKHQIWPWSYLYTYGGEEGNFEVPLTIEDEDGREFQAYRMLSWWEKLDCDELPEEYDPSDEECELLIVEGVGIHRLKYVRSSTFLLPAEPGCGMTRSHYCATLLMVTLNNDSEVYFKGFYGKNLNFDALVRKDEVIVSNNETERIYDLMGREIKNPIPGNIYICNRQKIILK